MYPGITVSIRDSRRCGSLTLRLFLVAVCLALSLSACFCNGAEHYRAAPLWEKACTGGDISLKVFRTAHRPSLGTAEISLLFEGADKADGEWSFSQELSEIMDSYYQLMGGEESANQLVESFGVEGMLSSLIEAIRGGSGGLGRFLIMLFGISLLFLCAELLRDSMGENGALVLSAVGAALSVPAVSWLSEVIACVREGLSSATELFSGLIPVFTSVSALGGGSATAVAEGVGMSITLGIVSAIITGGLLPLVMLSFALGMLASFDTGGALAPLIRGLRSFFMLVLGGVTTLLVGTLALQSLITNAKDTLALRGVKYAVSGMIPMVGGSVSSALGALVSGVSLAKGTVGAGALVSLVTMLGAPLLQLLLFRLAFRICISFLELTGSAFGAKVLGGIQSALDGLISVLASSAVIFILEVVIFMKLGAPVL